MPMNQTTQTLGEKEILQDTLIVQKAITSSYNTFAGECTSEQLRNTFLNILTEEHKIQADIFSDMQTNGWYQTMPAEQQKIQNARQKYSQQP